MSATLDIAAFRAAYPEFADATKFPDLTIELWWTDATNWISVNSAQGDPLPEVKRQYALYIMTAHIGKIATMIASGEDPAYVSQSSTSKISVTTLAPVAQDEFGFWLTTTPYGLKLAAFLRGVAARSFYIGGSNATQAFRNADGSFG